MKPQICICIDKNLEDHIDNFYNSLICNTKDFDLYILCSPDVDVNKLMKYKAIVYENIDMSKFFDTTKLTCKNQIRSPMMYARYFAPEIINVDKLIYTDVDTIFEADLHELWNIKNSHILCASPLDVLKFESSVLIREQCNNEKNYIPGEIAYASGLIVFNCKLWRKGHYFYKMVNFNIKEPMLDMPLYNAMCYKEIGKINDAWCVPANYTEGNKNTITKQEYKEIKCWHWNGEKPWEGSKNNIEVYNKYNQDIPIDFTICIPTINQDISKQLKEIRRNTIGQYEIVVSSKQQSAAKNRNACIEKAKSKIIIMLDDDIYGLYPAWNIDLIDFKWDKVSMVSSCVDTSQLGKDEMIWIEGGLYKANIKGVNVVAGMCIAFEKDELRFNEKYIGSGWEDSDFCMQKNKKYVDKYIIINCNCRLKHKNEAKNQGSNNQYNKELFESLWGKIL